MVAMVGRGRATTCRPAASIDATGIGAGSVEGFALVGPAVPGPGRRAALRLRLQQREAHFRELAHTDPLTGLANRRGLLRALHEPTPDGAAAVRAGRHRPGRLQERQRHARPRRRRRRCWSRWAHRLRRNLRPGDVAARLGGDEFAVLMRARAGRGDAGRRAAARRCSASRTSVDGGTVFLSASIGLAGCATADRRTGELLRNADLALRYAKQRGKNRVERYDVRVRPAAAPPHHAGARAARRDRPRRAAPGRSSRWWRCRRCGRSAPRRCCAGTTRRWATCRPDEFIPVAEESGLINRLGAWVLHQACHQLSRWLADGHDVWVSVNVSPARAARPGVRRARSPRCCARTGVPPQRLVLEVTEHAVATDMEELVRRLRRAAADRRADRAGRLRRRATRRWGSCARLPVDILKIDQQPGGRAGVRPDRHGARRWSTWWSGSATGSASR